MTTIGSSLAAGIWISWLFFAVFSALSVPEVWGSGTIYIRADGSIDPPTESILRDGDTYALTCSINDPIVVEKDNITIDGAGYAIQGSAAGGAAAIGLEHRTNVTIKNIGIGHFYYGIGISYSSNINISGNHIFNQMVGILIRDSYNYNSVSGNDISSSVQGILISGCSSVSISGNNVTANEMGIVFSSAAENIVYENNIANNKYGIYVSGSSNNTIYHNNFRANRHQAEMYATVGSNVWDNGFPSGGNYWSNYTGADANGDGIGDTPHVIDANNQDRYPLMNPWGTTALHPSEPQVKSGDWIRLDYVTSGMPSGTPLPQWIKIEFLSVEGTTASIRVTMHMSDGTEPNQTMPVNVAVGGGSLQGLSGLVIPANCTIGDSVHITGCGDVTIAGETTKTYAGASRTVVYASYSQLGSQFTYYWDKQTGVMVEALTTSGSITGTAKASETNMWQAQLLGLPFDQTYLYVLVAAAIAIAVVSVAFIMRRKKKPSELVTSTGVET